jgi:dephospho-CoA kinase
MVAGRHREPSAGPPRIVLAGPTCAGKTTLADGLSRATAWPIVTARAAIVLHAGRALDARGLATAGFRLEAQFPGVWLASAVAAAVAADQAAIVDAARTSAQVIALRESSPWCTVVYLTADVETRRRRYGRRGCGTTQFDALANSSIERGADLLAGNADLCVDTSSLSATQILSRVLTALGGSVPLDGSASTRAAEPPSRM